ncbi:spore cortex biosynthesis protein YabQ [Metallumcola ferriviriculae]|uniref:Spore cortex biosynthesis protein YabQ n=1 Tax=Metallumcola ferriviriculae TaxID=3039180 RepID=A0AAU0UJH5_9FIRM|nr:spore cortex biosynthesis protein YabQ [Desulfitibacteraceae bacterium MK1]
MVSVITQVQYFLWTVAIGLAIAFAFDFYRALRAEFRPPRWIGHAGDFTFWVLATIIGYFALLKINWGEVRLYVLLGIGLGALVYYAVGSRTVFKLWLQIFDICRRIIFTSWRIALFPFKILKRILKIPLGLLTLLLYKLNGIIKKFTKLLRGLATVPKRLWRILKKRKS